MEETSRTAAFGERTFLNTAADAAFDRLTRLAVDIFDVPIATIAIVDGEGRWFEGGHGAGAVPTLGTASFCMQTVLHDDVMVVEDAKVDLRFAGNPSVIDEPRIRFYAGAPLLGGSGERIGALSIMDRQPRRLSERHRRLLAELAAVVVDEISLTAVGTTHAQARGGESKQPAFDDGVRLGFVTQQLPAILWTTDRELRFSSALGAGLGAIGVDADQLVGMALSDFFANDPAARLNIDAHRAALDGRGTSTDARFGARVYQCRIDPLRDAKGVIAGTIGVALDITDRKLMEEKLIQAERLASMGTLAAGVAHEINNPLTYVMANIGFVSERLGKLALDVASQQASAPGGPTPLRSEQLAELTTALAEAQQGTVRVRQIIRDLKILARGDEERHGAIDVRHVIESSINMVCNQIRQRAELIKDFGDVPLVEASESRLGQVVLNLLVNATQAIREGEAAVNQIRIGTRTDPAGQAVITVADTGAGIPPRWWGASSIRSLRQSQSESARVLVCSSVTES